MSVFMFQAPNIMQIQSRLLSPQDYLFLDGISGELLTTGIAFDRERVPQLTLVAQARDRRLPPRVAHTLITIVVEVRVKE